MARNEEKQLGRLNRLVLKQIREDSLKKNPKRPNLNQLHTAEDVQKWLPSIKNDIDFYLKQSQVPCYPDKMIQEFSRKIDFHKRQYKAFVDKLKQLNPEIDAVPWTERSYASKRKYCCETTDPSKDQGLEAKKLFQMTYSSLNEVRIQSEKQTLQKEIKEDQESSQERQDICTDERKKETLNHFKPIPTPILNIENKYPNMYAGYMNIKSSNNDPKVNTNNAMNEPLQFKHYNHELGNNRTKRNIEEQFLSPEKCLQSSCGLNQTVVPSKISLNLPYSDSSSSDEEEYK